MVYPSRVSLWWTSRPCFHEKKKPSKSISITEFDTTIIAEFDTTIIITEFDTTNKQSRQSQVVITSDTARPPRSLTRELPAAALLGQAGHAYAMYINTAPSKGGTHYSSSSSSSSTSNSSGRGASSPPSSSSSTAFSTPAAAAAPPCGGGVKGKCI